MIFRRCRYSRGFNYEYNGFYMPFEINFDGRFNTKRTNSSNKIIIAYDLANLSHITYYDTLTDEITKDKIHIVQTKTKAYTLKSYYEIIK
jgi:hypothetical protein